MLLRVVAHDRKWIGRRHVPAGGEIRGRPLRRNPERDLDLAEIGREAGTATHGAMIALPEGAPKGHGLLANDFIRSLAKRVNDIEMMYDYLCEFVHPNYGSNLLVSTGKLGAGRLDPPADIHAEHITRACACVLLVLIEVECLVSSGGAALLRLDNYITIAMRPNQAAGAIFSVQTLTHEGDGKTKASAIFFTKARTPQEAVEMIYRHLERHGIEITGPKMIGGIEAGFIFDIFQTTQGKVWFKTAMLKI